MLQLKNTPDIKALLTEMMANPVLAAIISAYDFDSDYLYIPEERINDKELVEEFIEQGLLTRNKDETVLEEN